MTAVRCMVRNESDYSNIGAASARCQHFLAGLATKAQQFELAFDPRQR